MSAQRLPPSKEATLRLGRMFGDKARGAEAGVAALAASQAGELSGATLGS